MRKSTADRFWEKVEKTDTCWNWTAYLNPEGYGHFREGSSIMRAHRWAYLTEVGPIPEELVLDHLCRNRRCVRPDHLEVVTRQVNTLRGETLAAAQVLRTHCPKGHEYTEDNTIKQGDGKRRCRKCKNAYRRTWRTNK